MTIRTIEKRLKALEQLQYTQNIKVFKSYDFCSREDLDKSIEQHKQDHPNDIIISFLSVDSNLKGVFRGTKTSKDSSDQCT